MGGLAIHRRANEAVHKAAAAPSIAPLRGVPVPTGKHTRFSMTTGKPLSDTPSASRPKLRGVAPAAGTHIRFGDATDQS
jgi:hypothetical protein